LKSLMECKPIYALKGSPVNESPLGLFAPDQYAEVLESDYGVPRRYLTGIMSPWAIKRLQEFGGDISKFRVARVQPSVLRQIAISKTEPGDENNQDISTLVGKVDIRKLDRYSQSDTDDAEEVDEQTFFHDTKSGGTIVCSALELMHEICGARYPASTWNIYAAQASDGEAFGADVGKSGRFLREALLPLARYFAYIEIPATSYDRASSLWREYEQAAQNHRNLAMRRVRERGEIYPVFRELFSTAAA